MVSPRIQPLNKQHILKTGGYVLYIMRCLRISNSASFSFASQCANNSKVPLIAVYFYIPENHNLPQRVFALEGLKELKDSMNELKVKLLCVKEKNYTETLKEVHKLTDNACEVVIDAAYLRNDRDFEDSLNDQLIKSCRRLTRVEANVSVPVNVSSNQQEFGARTLRPKVWQYVKAMMKEKWEDVPTEPCKDWKKLVKADDLKEMDLEAELKKAESECKSDSGLTGGEKAAKKMLDFFITNRLVNYHPGRNVPGSKYQSVLSPYLHFGMLSTIETIKRAKEGKAAKHPIDSFIEELLVRRDLAHNFVYYARKNYDSLDSLPDWAKKTLKEHKNDKREYVYSYEELENAKTHDVYWNAAQLEMIHTNKMHGYMRMYWGKKVIEWTPDYETAYKFLIEQNDKYELDGRDPNGYTGVMWNFGLHDRAHAERAVFGKLRFMNAEGLHRKYKKTIGDWVRFNYKLAGRKVDGPVEPPKKKATNQKGIGGWVKSTNKESSESKKKPGKRAKVESEEDEEEGLDLSEDSETSPKVSSSKRKKPVRGTQAAKKPTKEAKVELESESEEEELDLSEDSDSAEDLSKSDSAEDLSKSDTSVEVNLSKRKLPVRKTRTVKKATKQAKVELESESNESEESDEQDLDQSYNGEEGKSPKSPKVVSPKQKKPVTSTRRSARTK